MVLISRWCLRTTSGLSTLANVAKHPVYFQPRADLVGDRHNQVAVAEVIRGRDEGDKKHGHGTHGKHGREIEATVLAA